MGEGAVALGRARVRAQVLPLSCHATLDVACKLSEPLLPYLQKEGNCFRVIQRFAVRMADMGSTETSAWHTLNIP